MICGAATFVIALLKVKVEQIGRLAGPRRCDDEAVGPRVGPGVGVKNRSDLAFADDQDAGQVHPAVLPG